jgi:hypothetical protein
MSLPHKQPVDQSARPRPARWVVGFMAVAAMTMVLSGFFQVVEGIAALSQNEIYLASIGYLFWLDLPVWGGIHVAMGVLLMAAGFTLRTATLWSRVVAVAFAGLSMIAGRHSGGHIATDGVSGHRASREADRWGALRTQARGDLER